MCEAVAPEKLWRLAIGAPEARAERGARRYEAELLIDCEEDRTLRAVLVGMLREAERN